MSACGPTQTCASARKLSALQGKPAAPRTRWADLAHRNPSGKERYKTPRNATEGISFPLFTKSLFFLTSCSPLPESNPPFKIEKSACFDPLVHRDNNCCQTKPSRSSRCSHPCGGRRLSLSLPRVGRVRPTRRAPSVLLHARAFRAYALLFRCHRFFFGTQIAQCRILAATR